MVERLRTCRSRREKRGGANTTGSDHPNGRIPAGMQGSCVKRMEKRLGSRRSGGVAPPRSLQRFPAWHEALTTGYLPVRPSAYQNHFQRGR